MFASNANFPAISDITWSDFRMLSTKGLATLVATVLHDTDLCKGTTFSRTIVALDRLSALGLLGNKSVIAMMAVAAEVGIHAYAPFLGKRLREDEQFIHEEIAHWRIIKFACA